MKIDGFACFRAVIVHDAGKSVYMVSPIEGPWAFQFFPIRKPKACMYPRFHYRIGDNSVSVGTHLHALVMDQHGRVLSLSCLSHLTN